MNHYKAKMTNLYYANRVLCIAVFISILALAVLSQLTSKEQVSFIGLTESKQLKLSYERPVQVKKIHIIPGQEVKKGDLLIEVQQPDLEVQINTLNNEVESLINEFKLSKEIATQKKFVESDFIKYSSDPQILLISSKNKQLEHLYTQKRKQKYYADFDGFVDAVFFKAGEIVQAFTPIAQINSTSPDYVKIYLLEGSHDQLSLKDEVNVSSLVNKYSINAQVVNLGKSMVQLPTRLQIAPQVIQWGREASIKLPANNKFIVGEKIHVTNKPQGFLIKSAKATPAPVVSLKGTNPEIKSFAITNTDTDNSGTFELKKLDNNLSFEILDPKTKKNAFPILSRYFKTGLYNALKAKSSTYKMNFLKEFEIGSFAINQDSLYLSLKSKNIESKFVILKVEKFKSNIKSLINVSIWKEIELPVNYNIKPSDIALLNDSLFLTATSESDEQKQMTYAFQLDLTSDKLKLINSWSDRSIHKLNYKSEAKLINIELNSKDGGRNNEIIVLQ